MKIAYLILAHTDPVHLRHLIAALDNGDNSFYIHVDRKVPIGPFTSAVPSSPNVVFLKNRKTISWGSFNIVAATILLIRESLAQPVPSDYYVLLSGLDYPIKSNTAITGFFERHPGRQFIRYTRIADCPFLQNRISRFHLAGLHSRLARPTEAILARFLPERPFFRGMVPYFGSQWWALTHSCIQSIISYINAHRRYIFFFRFVGIPDEIFFHTIVLNAGFLNDTNTAVALTKWDARPEPIPEAGEHFKYMDWSVSREQPAVLDDRDFDGLNSSPMPFARKFSSIKSAALIEKINRELL